MYYKTITHINRSAVVLLVDCSLSMKSKTLYHNTVLTKQEVSFIVANHIIEELVVRCDRRKRMRDYFDVAAIGYSGDEAFSLLPSYGEGFVKVIRLAEDRPQPRTVYLKQRFPDNSIKEMPHIIYPWVETSASGASPMYDALLRTRALVSQWCKERENCNSFPPLIINITDGVCSDAYSTDLVDIAFDIRRLSTSDGKALIMTLHLSTIGDHDEPSEVYPCDLDCATCDQDRALMRHMSSLIPEELEPFISMCLHEGSSGPYRALALNHTPCSILAILNIGSISTYLR